MEQIITQSLMMNKKRNYYLKSFGITKTKTKLLIILLNNKYIKNNNQKLP
jgi:hypothetical protein